MSDEPERVRVEELDWASMFPFLRIFSCFRMAIHPSRLLTALLLVALIYIIGNGMDAIWGPQVLPGEIELYRQDPVSYTHLRAHET